MSIRVVGTCGNCGGQVCVPTFWLGIYPPTPMCRSCRSTPRAAHGAVILMRPMPKQRFRVRVS